MSKTKILYKPSALNKADGKYINGDVQPQNVKGGKVYIFGKNSSQKLSLEDESSGEDDTVFEMAKIRPRKSANVDKSVENVSEVTKKVKIITRPVFPNDTLSKFALLYGCTVAELKQVNKIYNEQDFHAVKQIRIPIQPHSLLTEKVEEERRCGNASHEHTHSKKSSSALDDDSNSDYEEIDDNYDNVRTVSITKELKAPQKFLKRMDEDIQKICESVKVDRPDPSDINRRLTTHCIRPRLKKDSEELGSIWTGFGWKGAILVFITCAIIVPVLYFIYIEKFKS